MRPGWWGQAAYVVVGLALAASALASGVTGDASRWVAGPVALALVVMSLQRARQLLLVRLRR